MKKLFVLFLLLLLVFSCKTIGIQNQTYTQVELATIGESIKSLSKKEFQTNAIPTITNKIRVNITSNPFTKKSFNTFKQASKQLNKSTNLTYVDSLENKPTYTTITILDKVTLLNNLNHKENTNTFNYLKTVDNAKLVTEISLVFPNIFKQILKEAEVIYLIQSKHKKYALEVITKNNKQVLNFTDATVFDYKTTYFCWAEDAQHNIIIADITNNCNKNTFKNYVAAKKNKSSFKLLKL